MIHYIKRKNVDLVKYNTCIETSTNPRVYALSYYLDVVADQWDVLVLEDYKAVMPLPWRRKYGIPYIYPPCWTQQLGVYSTSTTDKKIVAQFLKAIPKKFLKITLQLHSQNSICTTVKDNYYLALNKPYETLLKGYRKDRKDRLKKYSKQSLTLVKDNDIRSVISLFLNNYEFAKSHPKAAYNKLLLLAENPVLNSFVLKIYNQNQQLISGSFFVIHQKRIYYVFSANSKEGNKAQGNTATLNWVIQHYANTDFILDFEGSVIPGIASFFKSFGSELETYPVYKKRIF